MYDNSTQFWDTKTLYVLHTKMNQLFFETFLIELYKYFKHLTKKII